MAEFVVDNQLTVLPLAIGATEVVSAPRFRGRKQVPLVIVWNRDIVSRSYLLRVQGSGNPFPLGAVPTVILAGQTARWSDLQVLGPDEYIDVYQYAVADEETHVYASVSQEIQEEHVVSP